MPRKLKNVVGLREILLISGLGLLGYGLFLFIPWVSYAVCGTLVLVGGFFCEEES